MDTTSSGGPELSVSFNRNRRSALIALAGLLTAEIVLFLIWSNWPPTSWLTWTPTPIESPTFFDDLQDIFWQTLRSISKISANVFGALLFLLIPPILFFVYDAVWGIKNRNSKMASYPMMLIALGVFVLGTIWTVLFSFTNIKIIPLFTPAQWWNGYVGFANYKRLFNTSRWMDCPAVTRIGMETWKFSCTGALPNMVTYAVLSIAISVSLGFLLAVMMDQKIRSEGVFRTIFLYPFALSFVVTGHVWAWIMSPEYGLQHSVRALGWASFSFDWIANRQMVMYAIVIAGIWQGTGFVMALMLAGLRGIDEDIWKAARVDGIPAWRTYLQIVLPMMKPVLVTTFVIVTSGAVRIYDLVVATTDGGPGISSDVPSRYIYQNFSANLAQSLSASTVLLVAMAVVLIPWIRIEFGKKSQG